MLYAGSPVKKQSQSDWGQITGRAICDKEWAHLVDHPKLNHSIP